MIIEKEKSFWNRADEKDVQAIVCTLCNVIKNDGSLVMGKGCAKQFSDTFPFLAKNWGALIQGIAESGRTDF
ncbi:hypothetical protein ACI3PL_26625, partial [Lacticaseibacillus paracasei]